MRAAFPLVAAVSCLAVFVATVIAMGVGFVSPIWGLPIAGSAALLGFGSLFLRPQVPSLGQVLAVDLAENPGHLGSHDILAALTVRNSGDADIESTVSARIRQIDGDLVPLPLDLPPTARILC